MSTYEDSGFTIIFESHDTGKDRIVNELDDFSKLKPGWKFGDGTDISRNIIESAKKIYREGRKYDLMAEVYPEIDGTITISFQNDDHFLDIQMINDLRCRITHEKGIGKDYTKEVLGEFPLSDVNRRISWFLKKSQPNLSESLTSPSIMTREKNDSDLPHFSVRAMEAAFRHLMTPVENKDIYIQYANTSWPSIEHPVASQ
ncbi:MAG: hypothetical protein R6U55_10995 [Desulfovermiculus sp.]